jgi:hypothetical protein
VLQAKRGDDCSGIVRRKQRDGSLYIPHSENKGRHPSQLIEVQCLLHSSTAG